jgi:hypothetical protein
VSCSAFFHFFPLFFFSRDVRLLIRPLHQQNTSSLYLTRINMISTAALIDKKWEIFGGVADESPEMSATTTIIG